MAPHPPPLPDPGDNETVDCAQLAKDIASYTDALTKAYNNHDNALIPILQKELSVLTQEFQYAGCGKVSVDRPLDDSIKILMVLDSSRATFGKADPTAYETNDQRHGTDLGLTELIAALTYNNPSSIKISITPVHRKHDLMHAALYDDFKFRPLKGYFFDTLSYFDEIWLFGVAGNDDDISLTDDEKEAIAEFMNAKGGVFATGDHEDLGLPLCGKIPRVRSMRKWYWPAVGPNGEPIAPSSGGIGTIEHPFSSKRLDTLRPGHEEFYDQQFPGDFLFDDQSDDIPQIITPEGTPHPLLRGLGNKVITVLPDHMHEGQVILPQSEPTWYAERPFDPNMLFKVGNIEVDEYPLVNIAGKRPERPLPEIVAWGTVLRHSTKPGLYPQSFGDPLVTDTAQFGVIGAYNGWRARVGRVVVDSSWHHFFDLNLIGDPVSAKGPPPMKPEYDKTKGFLASTQGRATLSDIETYYRNIAYWLAPRGTQMAQFAHVTTFLRWTQPLNEVIRVRHKYSDAEILEIGRIAAQALTRMVPQWVGSDWLQAHLERIGLDTFLSEDARAQPMGLAMNAILASGQVLEAALGGAVVALAEMVSPVGGSGASDLQGGGKQISAIEHGATAGLAAFARELRKRAEAFEFVGKNIEDKLSKNKSAPWHPGQPVHS
jgi:hypothetical protein